MKTIIVDIETSGLDIDSSVLSFSYILLEDNKIIGRDTRYYHHEKGNTYNKKAIEINCLTEGEIKNLRNGVTYPKYFADDEKYVKSILEVDEIVAHNIDFEKMFLPNTEAIPFCTMLENTLYVGILNYYGYKYPKLSESLEKYGILYNENRLHRSDYDVEMTYQLYLKTKERISNE